MPWFFRQNLPTSAGSEINFFRQAPTGEWKIFLSRHMEKCGNQLWNSGHQCKIFSRIGDQESAISDPVVTYEIYGGQWGEYTCW